MRVSKEVNAESAATADRWRTAIHELKAEDAPLHCPAGADQGQAVSSRPMPRASSHTDQPM
jgi:hypothetical protein